MTEAERLESPAYPRWAIEYAMHMLDDRDMPTFMRAYDKARSTGDEGDLRSHFPGFFAYIEEEQKMCSRSTPGVIVL